MTTDEELLLPPGACLLHIGPYKTGSTTLQRALQARRAELPAYGVVYPGTGIRAMRPGWAVLGYTPRGRKPVPIRVWQELVDEVEAARDRRVCVSTEDFGSAGPAIAARIAADLGADRLHVVAVARRLDRLLPSQWQERVKSHDTLTYDRWLGYVLGDDREHREWRRFWASHDVVRMADRWAPAVGLDRFALIPTDDSDRLLVTHTFERLLGLPAGFLAPADTWNSSLSAQAVEMLRRVNEAAERGSWPDEVYYRLVQRGLVAELLAHPRHQSEAAIPPLPGWAVDRVAELSRERVDQIMERGIRVLGDPEVMLCPPAAGQDAEASERAVGPRAVQPAQTVAMDTAVHALSGVFDAAARERGRLNGPRSVSSATSVADLSDLADLSVGELTGIVGRRAVRRVRRALARVRRPPLG